MALPYYNILYYITWYALITVYHIMIIIPNNDNNNDDGNDDINTNNDTDNGYHNEL